MAVIVLLPGLPFVLEVICAAFNSREDGMC